jgi:hypothetical protein
MLAVNLMTPVDLGYIFDVPDLKDTGIELDSHITLLYAQGKEIPKDNIIQDLKDMIDYYDFINTYCKNQVFHKVLDIFDLGSFENDSDYIILKMKRNFDLYNKLSLINKGLRIQYGVSSDFDQYTPHVSLAELKPGTAEKYLTNENLKLVLNDTYVNFEDLMISYGKTNEKDRKQYFLTHFKCVDRYFRIRELEKANE